MVEISLKGKIEKDELDKTFTDRYGVTHQTRTLLFLDKNLNKVSYVIPADTKYTVDKDGIVVFNDIEPRQYVNSEKKFLTGFRYEPKK